MKRCLETPLMFGFIYAGHCSILDPSSTQSLEYLVLYVGYERRECALARIGLYLGARLFISCIGHYSSHN
jgi:hypothetical protein